MPSSPACVPGWPAARRRPQDDTAAAKWTRLAAEQGVARAQFNLGILYGLGRGVPQDYAEAYRWFNLAASRYSDSEKELRDIVFKNRDLAASLTTPESLAAAQQLAREWHPK